MQERIVSELYSREALAGYDPECLRKAVALVVGAGALGQNAIQNLTLSGVGEQRIVDFDLFEAHNSTRSPFYGGDGAPKALAVAAGAKKLSPTPTQRFRYADASIEELGDGAFAGVSVVVCAVDNGEARGVIADYSRLHGIPLIEGGFEGPSVTVSGYKNDPSVAWSEPCWRCANPTTSGSISCRLYAQEAEKQRRIPAIQTGAAFVGALVAEAAILSMLGAQVIGDRSVDLNVRTGVSRPIIHTRDPLCTGPHRTYLVPLGLDSGPASTVGELFAEISKQSGLPTFFVKLRSAVRAGHSLPKLRAADSPSPTGPLVAQNRRPMHRLRRPGRSCAR